MSQVPPEMSDSALRISLSDLASAGILLSHSDAVTIAREAGRRWVQGELAAIPSPDDLRLSSDGAVESLGTPTPGNEIRRAARLLAALLAQADGDAPSPATFRLILARAFADDEAAYESVDQFLAALTPFAGSDARRVVRDVVEAWRSSVDSSLDEFAPEPPSPGLLVFPTAAAAVPEPEPACPAAADATIVAEKAPEISRPRRTLKRRVSPRKWIPAVAAAALLVALLSVWWSWARSRSTRVVQEQTNSDKADNPTASDAVVTQPASSPSEKLQQEVTAGPSPTVPSEKQPPPPVPSIATSGGSTRSEATPTEVIREAAFSPSFASTASAMFYHSGTGPRSAIMRADTDDNGMVLRVTEVVADRGSNFHPRPSPDGQLLAFDSDRDGERGIYVADSNGRNVRRVSGPGFATVPSWSPDGRRLAFVRAEPGKPRVWNIWTVDMPGALPCALPVTPLASPGEPHGFPMGIASPTATRTASSSARCKGRNFVFSSLRSADVWCGPPPSRRTASESFSRSAATVRGSSTWRQGSCLECWRTLLLRSSPGRRTAGASPTIAADRGPGASGRWHRVDARAGYGFSSLTGRTSMLPSRAGGILAAT